MRSRERLFDGYRRAATACTRSSDFDRGTRLGSRPTGAARTTLTPCAMSFDTSSSCRPRSRRVWRISRPAQSAVSEVIGYRHVPAQRAPRLAAGCCSWPRTRPLACRHAGLLAWAR